MIIIGEDRCVFSVRLAHHAVLQIEESLVLLAFSLNENQRPCVDILLAQCSSPRSVLLTWKT